MTAATVYLDRRFYPGVVGNWDDQMFREEILQRIDSSTALLDVGAGAGIVADMNFQGLAGRVCGVDLDERVLENPALDDARVASAEEIPYPDSSFDLVFSDNVLEHLAEPGVVFAEIARVLKPGGLFLFKTPNRRHYMPLIARLTPHRFHQFVNRIRGREAVDTFPTLYRANSRRQVDRLAKETGFDVISLSFVEGRPEYLRMFWPTYAVGIAYERLVNSSSFFSSWRILMIGMLRKSL